MYSKASARTKTMMMSNASRTNGAAEAASFASPGPNFPPFMAWSDCPGGLECEVQKSTDQLERCDESAKIPTLEILSFVVPQAFYRARAGS